ncbi:GHKL domain-containing protein [Rossellomorea marisflavi]|uniref:sensor histidine kinase n=1 Tax=Rossellomorea marisflavi TaxID=189381 RepID=UPI0028534E00|nr:GHKL domain-containing protein [Rossellomorea marisflavi]MDR4937821.1 GHKL domain-containing protein [Rossellomorea marisflavi]
MTKSFIHRGIIIVLGFIHLHGILTGYHWIVSYLIPAVLVMGMMYAISLKTTLHSMGNRWDGMFYLLQLFLIVPSLMGTDLITGILLLLVFIGLEWLRTDLSEKLSIMMIEKQHFETERLHLNETFRIVRSERHDFLKHVSALHFMLDHDQHSEAKMYLNDLVDGYEETNLSIKGERGSIAGILHQMYRDATKAGLSMVYDTDLPLSTMPMTDKKLVMLLGNLLSNSIDAAAEWQEETGEKGTITMQFFKRSGLYILKVVNPSLKIPGPVLDKLYQTHGITTKSGEHQGLGSAMIMEIVNEYEGYLDFIHKDQHFEVKLKFPAIH